MTLLGGIEADELMRAAERQTGLHEWGNRGFEPRLRRLCTALEAEVRLRPLGRLGARQRVLGYLISRLQLEQLQQQDPCLTRVQLPSPVFITGYPRTGTTLLYQLLARDPRFRAPQWWEALLPLPPPPLVPDEQRIAQAQRVADASLDIAKGVQEMHPLRDVREREEDYLLLERSFFSITYAISYDIPDYFDWLLAQSEDVARDCYDEYRGWVRVLMRYTGPARWLSKTPAHLPFVFPLLQVFPDATVIYLERDPRRCVASFCSLVSAMRRGTLDISDPSRVGRLCLQLYRDGVRRVATAVQRYPSRIVILSYEDFMRCPIQTVRALTERLGMEPCAITDTDYERLIASNRPPASGRDYALGDYGLCARDVDRVTIRLAG